MSVQRHEQPMSYKWTDDRWYESQLSYLISWHFHVIMNDFMTPTHWWKPFKGENVQTNISSQRSTRLNSFLDTLSRDIYIDHIGHILRALLDATFYDTVFGVLGQ